jgi:PPOX class probable F420-dependent enzyme
MPREMSHEEWRAFLMEGTRTGKLGVVRKDGRPHVVPVWFVLDEDDTIVFTTGARTVKGHAIRRDPRVALCVDDERPPFAYVMVEGEASISEDLDEVLVWATRLGGRYMGADQAEAFGKRNAVPGELLVRVRPVRVHAEADIAA